MDKPDNQNERLMSALCYAFGIVSGVIFLNIDPHRNNPTIRFHAWQSIFFFLAWFALSGMARVFHFGFFYVWFLAPFVGLAAFVLWVMLIVKAYNGERLQLPLITELAERQARG